jgi:hypothetical protein
VGNGVQSFSDAKPVIIPAPVRAHVSYSDVRVLAKMLAEGARAWIETSAGSSASSEHGLAFLSLDVSVPGCPNGVVTLGTTVVVNGRCVCSGAIDVR